RHRRVVCQVVRSPLLEEDDCLPERGLWDTLQVREARSDRCEDLLLSDVDAIDANRGGRRLGKKHDVRDLERFAKTQGVIETVAIELFLVFILKKEAAVSAH